MFGGNCRDIVSSTIKCHELDVGVVSTKRKGFRV